MTRHQPVQQPDLATILACDRWAREEAQRFIS